MKIKLKNENKIEKDIKLKSIIHNSDKVVISCSHSTVLLCTLFLPTAEIIQVDYSSSYSTLLQISYLLDSSISTLFSWTFASNLSHAQQWIASEWSLICVLHQLYVLQPRSLSTPNYINLQISDYTWSIHRQVLSAWFVPLPHDIGGLSPEMRIMLNNYLFLSCLRGKNNKSTLADSFVIFT